MSGLRVVDFSFGIAGGYCSKLLSDAGADVVKVEPPDGDPWRRWTSSRAPVDAEIGSPLFRFLHHGKRSVVAAGAGAMTAALQGADVVIEGLPDDPLSASELASRAPGLVVASITPFGRGGPFADRPATEFIVQAESGGLIGRGGPTQVPIMAGGRISEWVAGTFAAVAVAAAAWRARHTGHGEYIDFSIAEAMTIAGCSYADFRYQMMGCPPITGVNRTFETPSIEPTLDGYVGFCTNSRQQFDDFLVLIERPDLLGDDELASFPGRQKRWDEWNAAVKAYTRPHTTAEILDRASALRIPVAPVHSGADVLHFAHFVERGVFVRDPTDSFTMPRRPWQMDFEPPPPPRRSPRLGEHTGRIEPVAPVRRGAPGAARLPLDGVRVLDLTSWWAGPVAAGLVATLGADVIHVESVTRVDGIRMTGALTGTDGPWWERAPMYLCPNTNKRDLTIDLATPEGRDVLSRLIERSDAIIENFTPRVLPGFGFDWPAIRQLNPRCVLVRMPAFGLSGPWSNNTGFAQTMEQVTGMAWVTGHAWDQPRIQRGPSDPNAGMHAAFSLLVGLFERDATGRGCHIETTMVEGALNAAAELVIEYTAHGAVLERDGNRSPNAAPQGIYPCRDFDTWLAISVVDDEQWKALVAAMGSPAWSTDPALAAYEGRYAARDRLDEAIAQWAADRDVESAATLLVDAGVPAAAARDPRLVADHPQYQHRRFYEPLDHPVVGTRLTPTVPFRFASVDRWLRRPAPTLGQHNHEILVDELGFTEETYAMYEQRGIIGSRPKGL